MSRQPDSLKSYESMGWVPMTVSVDEARKDVAAGREAEIAENGIGG